MALTIYGKAQSRTSRVLWLAKELGIPMGTVKTRLRLAFDKLRAGLAPIEDWVR